MHTSRVQRVPCTSLPQATYILFSALMLSSTALAQTSAPQPTAAVEVTPPPMAADANSAPLPAPAPAPYSLPFQLRPAVVGNVLRTDTSLAFYENPVSHNGGYTAATLLVGSLKLTDAFAVVVRLGLVGNSPPDKAAATTPAGMVPLEGKTNFINPVIGATYSWKLGTDWKLAAFLGFTVPVGDGGDDKPNPSNAEANARGALARSAFDNSLFAVNYFTLIPGVDLAYVAHGLTVQAEATLFQLERARGAGSPANKDEARTNFTTGLHVGYFVIPELSGGIELRHQRWLSTPSTIKGAKLPFTEDQLRDTTTFAFGIRVHIKVGDKSWIRPGLSFSLPLDDPMSKQKFKVLQIDVPVVF